MSRKKKRFHFTACSYCGTLDENNKSCRQGHKFSSVDVFMNIHWDKHFILFLILTRGYIC